MTQSRRTASVATSFDGTIFGKNLVINGAFLFWQRATTQTSSAYGSDDRWFNGHNGSTKSHVLIPAVAGAGLPESATQFSRTTVTSVANANNFVDKYQYIEDVRKLAGKTVTVSFYAKADANRPMSVSMGQRFGSGGSAGVDGVGATKFNLTTAWTRYTMSVTLPSIAGKTFGSTVSSTMIMFWFDAGSNFNSQTGSLGQQSGTFDLWGVQVEEGPTASNFEIRPEQVELALCQRYFTRLLPFQYHAATIMLDSLVYTFPLPTQMRTSTPNVATNISDSNFTTSGSTPAGLWAIIKPGISTATKSGTFTLAPSSTANTVTLAWYGFTINALFSAVNFGSGFYVDAEAEI